jgi:hypothetical protein
MQAHYTDVNNKKYHSALNGMTSWEDSEMHTFERAWMWHCKYISYFVGIDYKTLGPVWTSECSLFIWYS